MVRRNTTGSHRPRRGSSPRERANWRSTYEKTSYEELPWFESGPSPSVKLAVESGFLPQGGRVLDIGCGAGSNVLFLAETGYQANGIDLSPGAVAAARARATKAGLTVSVQEGDALALPFRRGFLEGVIDHGCFHTLPISRRQDYVQEVERVLRPGGKYLLAWVAREHTGPMGPPHRPSLREIATLFEARFLFERTGFRAGGEAHGEPSTYFAFMSRRTARYPPPR
jgi:SAM-dependent methyltransferase